MNKQFHHLKISLTILLMLAALCNYAQKQFTHTATKANNACNGDCTMLDVAELNDNPAAILWVTPLLENGQDLNPHPIGVYYFKSRWNIFNLDQKAMPPGSRFNVEYMAGTDPNHFQYTITNENIQRDGSAFIDHPALNNNPGAGFRLFVSWNPAEQRGITNRDRVSTQFNPETGKWQISNINKKPLFPRVVYNVVIADPKNTATTPVKINKDILKKDPRIINQPADSLPVIGRPIDKKDMVIKKPAAPSYDFSNVHICIEKVSGNNLPPKTVIVPPPSIPKIKSNGDLEPVSTVTQPLSGVTALMWTPGEVITVGFPSPSPFLFTNKVKQYVKEWETYANVTFHFINDVSLAKIRVGFIDDGTSWSWIGRDALTKPSTDMTINFGWFTAATKDAEFRRTILHEFGHALGFIHEHQAPTAGIAWDKPKVYSFYGSPPNNWDTATIDFNIFGKYSKTITNSSIYDPLSIMHYFFPAELTTDGSSFTWNTDLSAIDKSFSRQVYPFPPAPATATGVLKTGDDCDEIEFTVEYNVVHNSEVEFILQPGRDHHNALVNWWKMIGIPHKAGGITSLELNQTKKMQASSIDKTKAITFGKAKILGVHTGLGFTWSPWPAIVGGCRVKFVWRRDSCN